ncbi:MerR family transcriptional regulator [Alkanindiges hydrocarboniclasticus]|jgi:MerR family transcriptional regulator, mercuric resistance operon regulatory protein|uniref:MerR family transcriptional regulator n=1 Tax=Alkanindiges hydrocarboniclasticus TaxID=1907941 RepID=A0A1S8CSR9_9GAMM|nr:MerR family transcriptional regulator [Alkanindiges hydrocarboniclasticus]ONG39156.1 MerR family transcriptional regulator [Alkanindiges hydrocarboniclasticus]
MLTIGKLAKQAGVSSETIRYYQRIGLLRIPESTQAYRYYQAHDLERLLFIKRAKQAGLQLNEIAELLALDGLQDKQRVREVIKKRLHEIQHRIDELEHLQHRLSTWIDECEHSSTACCPILQALNDPAVSSDQIPRL